MQVSHNTCQPVRPGPLPVFSGRVVVKVRPEQVEAVQRIARVLGLTGSDIVRWFIDNGIQAVEGTDTYQQLKEAPHED